MVVGIEKFREFFKDYPSSYVIIGGTASDIIIDDAGLTPRATRDIDIILVIEVLSNEFVKQFWNFIQAGKYNIRQKSSNLRNCYRFSNPETAGFPAQLELFSRLPDVLDKDENRHLTPIPVEEDLSSLSAILLNDDYYHFTLDHSKIMDEMQLANPEALICLKAIAYMDNKKRREEGANINRRDVIKHKNDVFRLALMLAPENTFKLPETIKTDMLAFANTVKNNLPDNAIFKEMGAGNVDVEALFGQLLKNFNLNS